MTRQCSKTCCRCLNLGWFSWLLKLTHRESRNLQALHDCRFFFSVEQKLRVLLQTKSSPLWKKIKISHQLSWSLVAHCQETCSWWEKFVLSRGAWGGSFNATKTYLGQTVKGKLGMFSWEKYSLTISYLFKSKKPKHCAITLARWCEAI